jgi:hypothetical protein
MQVGRATPGYVDQVTDFAKGEASQLMFSNTIHVYDGI